jgi:RimJ/RimL family protein N-acetyltransferase
VADVAQGHGEAEQAWPSPSAHETLLVVDTDKLPAPGAKHRSRSLASEHLAVDSSSAANGSRHGLPMMHVAPLTLVGAWVRLEPLAMSHVDGLTAVGLDPELWRFIPTPVTTSDDMRTYVRRALDEQQRGRSLPFAIVDQASGRVIGSTRYGNIEPEHHRLEIGWTWITPAFQRSAANTEAKLLLLTHAFETLGAHRVELKTDALNQKSRNAILGIGAVEEGTFRRHVVTASGRVRDTVYFSIIDSEWSGVKARLSARLQLRSPRS